MAGNRRMRHGPPESLRKRRLRPRSLDRLGLRLRHRTHRHDSLRHQRHPPLLRKRREIPAAVLNLLLKMKFFIQIMTVSLLATLYGCRSHQAYSVDDQKKQWTSDGWTYLETFGNASDDAVTVVNSSSTTAKEITAFARVGGVATSKIYNRPTGFTLLSACSNPQETPLL